jgi:SAM-dependent methyltransferase
VADFKTTVFVDDILRRESYFANLRGPIKIKDDNRIPILLGWIGSDKKVLDLGISHGIMASLIQRVNIVVGMDTPAVVLAYHERYSDFTFFGGNAEDISFVKDSFFDVVFAGDLLIHLNNPEACILESKRVLKSDGFFVVSLPMVALDHMIYNGLDEDAVKNLCWTHDLFLDDRVEYVNGTTRGVLLKFRIGGVV